MKRKTTRKTINTLERPRYIVGMVRDGKLEMFARPHVAISAERAEEIANDKAVRYDHEFIVFKAVSSHKRAAPPIIRTTYRSR